MQRVPSSEGNLGASDQDSGELFDKGIEVTASESKMVHSQGGEAFSGAKLNGSCRSGILSKSFNLCLTDRVIGAFR